MGNVSEGGWTYYENLTHALGEVAPGDEFTLLTSPWQTRNFPMPPNFRRIKAGPAKRRVLLRVLWEQLRLPQLLRKLDVDVLFSPGDMTTLMAPCPVVLGIQNPNPYANLDIDFRYRAKFKLLKFASMISGWRADRVIVVSSYSREQVATQLQLPLTKVTAIHHGISEQFSSPPTLQNRRDPRFPRRYILCVSTIAPHKNYANLLRAYANLVEERAESPTLVIVGAIHSDSEYQALQQIADSRGIADRVRFMGKIDHAELPAIYRGADLFVLPSYLETFGLTVLEAMAIGTPVTASNWTAIPEIGGNAVLYFDPTDVEDISMKMRQLLHDQELRNDLIRHGLSRARSFTWTRTAVETRRVLAEAAGTA